MRCLQLSQWMNTMTNTDVSEVAVNGDMIHPVINNRKRSIARSRRFDPPSHLRSDVP